MKKLILLTLIIGLIAPLVLMTSCQQSVEIEIEKLPGDTQIISSARNDSFFKYTPYSVRRLFMNIWLNEPYFRMQLKKAYLNYPDYNYTNNAQNIKSLKKILDLDKKYTKKLAEKYNCPIEFIYVSGAVFIKNIQKLKNKAAL